MFAGCLQIMWAHWQLIRVEGVGYWHLIRAENTDVCSSYRLCLQAVTGTTHDSSHCNSIRACVCFRAAIRPLLISALSSFRSVSVSFTRYIFAGIV